MKIKINSDYVLTSFKNSRKNEKDTLVIESCRTSESRSECGMVKGLITHEDGATPVFIKFTPCNWYDKKEETYFWGTTKNASEKSAAYSEIQFFKLLDAFHDKNICNTFVKSYNSTFLKDDITEVEGRKVHKSDLPRGDKFFPVKNSADIYYSMLITQPLDRGFNELMFWVNRQQARIRKLEMTRLEFKAVFFQIMYAISCMSAINMAHMDLHFGNIFVKLEEGLRGQYNAYEFKNHKGKYETAYIPAHVIVKIIDLDGAYKFESDDINVAPEFRKHIPNTMWSGDTEELIRPNPRANVMKLMFHLHKNGMHLQGAFKPIVDANGKIPFVKKHIRKPLQQIMKWNNRDEKMVNRYGIFLNKHGAMIDMGDDFVKTPPELLHLLNTFKKKPTNSFTKEPIPVMHGVSQKGIFTKAPTPVAKKPKVVKRTKRTPFKPLPINPQSPTPRPAPAKKPKVVKRTKRTPLKPRPIKPPPPSPTPRPAPAKRITPPKLIVNNVKLVVPKITPSMVRKIRGFKQEVDMKCPKGPGRPKAHCADALLRHKEACKLDKSRVYKKRDCVPRGKPGRKPGVKRPVVNNGVSYEKKSAKNGIMNVLHERAMNVLKHRKDVLCNPRGRPSTTCKHVLEHMKILCAKKDGHVFKGRECVPKPGRPVKKV